MDADTVREEYEPRITAAMQRWADAIAATGQEVTCVDTIDGDEEYGWSFCFTRSQPRLERSGDLYDGDVTVYLTEEKVREGEGSGLSWFVSVVEVGGRILGTIAPYNYSPECWTNDPDELRARWEGIEASGDEIVAACLRD